MPNQIGWIRWLPGLLTLRQYQATWLAHDIVAGIVLATMLVPVGIAYAVASGVPGIYGLYATIVPLLAYALFGPSRILVLGPDSSLAAVILGVVSPLSGGDPLRAVALAGMMAVVSGIVCILAGVARLGFVTELLSKPIRYGYMNGIALTVLISQLPKLFGFSIEGDGPLQKAMGHRSRRFVDGRANWTAFAVGAGTLAVILLLKNSKRVPGILIAVVGATAIVGVLDLAGARRRVGPGSAPPGPACVRDPVDHLCRYRPGSDRRLRRRPGVVRRHQRPLPRLRGANRYECRSQSGDGRARSRQSGRRILSGFSDQQQFVTHPGGGGCRRPNAVDRGRRRARRRPAAVGGAESAPASAHRRIGRGRDRLGDRLDRDHRPGSNLSHPALGVLAIDRLLRGRRGSWRDPGHRLGDRDRRHRVPVGWLASALCGAGPRRRASRATTTSRAIPMPARYPVWSSFAGMHRCSSPTPSCSRSVFWMRWRNRPLRCAGWSLRQNRSPAWTSPRPMSSPNWTRPCTGPESSCAFAELKDPVKDKLKRFGLFDADWRKVLLSDHRSRRQQLPRKPCGRLGGLGGPRPTEKQGLIQL